MEGYRGNLERYLLPKIGKIRLERLSASQVQEKESALLRNGRKNGGPLSPRTLLQFHRILSKALKDAVKLGLISRNVAEMVKPPRTAQHEVRTLTWDQIPTFLDEVGDSQYKTLFLLDIQSGLRRSELLGLQWRDVDLEAGTLSVQRAWVQLPSGTRVTTVPKSGKGRAVDLPAQSVDGLRAHRESRGKLAGNGNLVFCHSDGSPLTPNQVTKKCKQVTTAAGVGDLRLHDLRHTHASLMLKEGVNLKITSERLGNSSLAITANLYSHVLPAVQKEAAQRFGDAWGGNKGLENSGNGKTGEECPSPPSFIAIHS